MTLDDALATIKEDSALLADWAEEPTAISNVDADNCRARIVAAVESVKAEIARLERRVKFCPYCAGAFVPETDGYEGPCAGCQRAEAEIARLAEDSAAEGCEYHRPLRVNGCRACEARAEDGAKKRAWAEREEALDRLAEDGAATAADGGPKWTLVWDEFEDGAAFPVVNDEQLEAMGLPTDDEIGGAA